MIFFEDMLDHESITSDSAIVDRDEMVAFATQWDPLSIHVDSEDAEAQGGPTAPGLFMLALKQRLVHQLPDQAVIASFGYDEVRFHQPLRPGDEVHLRYEFVDARPSASKPDRGIVTIRLSLVRSDGVVVLSHLDTVLVRRRATG